jgi:hypothetical protein
MPHVVIEDAPDLRAACLGVQPSLARTGSDILKVVDTYLNTAGRTALVECLAVEGGKSQAFFVQLSSKGQQITVRLLPATDPEKTDGVKRLMATIAQCVRTTATGSRYGKTNLQDFLE